MKSLGYRFWELCIRWSLVKALCRLEGNKLERIAEKAGPLQNPAPPVSIRRKFSVQRLELSTGVMYRLCPKGAPARRAVFHIHGGAYLIQLNAMAYGVEKRLIRLTGAAVYAPAYPLAPSHNCVDAMAMLTEGYRRVLKSSRRNASPSWGNPPGPSWPFLWGSS